MARWLLIASLSLLAMAGFWLLSDEAKTNNANESAALVAVPTYAVKGITHKLYNSDGKLSQTVQAESMEHFDELGFVTFAMPQYRIVTDNGHIFVVSAIAGTLYDNQHIQLESEVILHSEDSADLVQVITTDYLAIDLHSRIANTDLAVQVSGANINMQGLGLQADLNQQTFILADQVKAIYQVQ